MMNKKRIIYIYMCAILLSLSLNAQEQVMQLNYNYKLKLTKQATESIRNDSNFMLPFFDDFSYDQIIPKQSMWIDKDVYINNELCYKPVSVGVATFDALDENGNIYSHLNHNISRVADYLTSQAIRLDSVFDGYQMLPLHKQDSVYLSFFVQPANWSSFVGQGLNSDSLCLEFYSPVDSVWYHVWSTKRFDFNDIDSTENKGQFFREVIIPITDEEKFFHDGFRFRFYNYATITNPNLYPGWQVNGSQWSLDYVFLERNRRINAFYKDICFVEGAHSFLKDYYAMPYHQFCVAPFDEMLDLDNVLISNLDDRPNNVGYNYEVRDAKGYLLKEFQGGSGIIEPFTSSGYYNNPVTTPPVFPFAFPTSELDSAYFDIKHFISSDLGFKQNDTISFKQEFYNYYAYDDGSPEFAYSLTSTSRAALAVRFKLNSNDTLRAVKIFFNDIYGAPEYERYDLCVWNDQSSKPGEKIYMQNIKVYYDSLYNADYISFILDEPLVIDEVNFPHLVFYVGVEFNDEVVFALGLDNSKNNAENTYYNVLGEWTNSTISGTLMIRPVVGKELDITPGIDENTKARINLYPNPLTNSEYIYISDKSLEEDVYYTITDITGVVMLKGIVRVGNEVCINLSKLSNGIYLMVAYTKEKVFQTEKIIIER